MTPYREERWTLPKPYKLQRWPDRVPLVLMGAVAALGFAAGILLPLWAMVCP